MDTSTNSELQYSTQPSSYEDTHIIGNQRAVRVHYPSNTRLFDWIVPHINTEVYVVFSHFNRGFDSENFFVLGMFYDCPTATMVASAHFGHSIVDSEQGWVSPPYLPFLHSSDSPSRVYEPPDDDVIYDAESARNERLFILHAPLWQVQLEGIHFYNLPNLNLPRPLHSPTTLLIRYERDVNDPLYNPYDLTSNMF